MSAPTYTPGPWEVEPVNGGETYQITTAESRHFFVVAETPVDGTGRDEANARLIAAAPDLLEAAKRLLLIETDHGDPTGPEWDEARAAIAKATGAGQ